MTAVIMKTLPQGMRLQHSRTLSMGLSSYLIMHSTAQATIGGTPEPRLLIQEATPPRPGIMPMSSGKHQVMITRP